MTDVVQEFNESSILVDSDGVAIEPMPFAVFDYNHRRAVKIVVTGDSQAQESFLESTDINQIIDRFDRTGWMPPGHGDGMYGDCTPFQKDLTELVSDARQVIDDATNFAATWSPKPPESPSPQPPVSEPPSV